jgi:NAD(P)-dependent dehydrogenase (short-subunit alcohol dehydrogenase family)
MSFTDKRILVTGGSRGIGFAAAQAFLAAGARVAVNGRTAESAAAAAKKLGARALPAPGDIGTVAGCEAAVAAALEGLGGLDVLVNSAGVAEGRRIEKTDEALWDATLDVNLKGTFFTVRAALPALRSAQAGANIVNVASDAGLSGTAGLTVYCASKGGVVNLTRAMAIELAPALRVNCVCPGYVDTDMVRRDYIEQAKDPAALEAEVAGYAPLKRMARPEEIAGAILYLASPAAAFVTGTALVIDGGSTAGR